MFELVEILHRALYKMAYEMPPSVHGLQFQHVARNALAEYNKEAEKILKEMEKEYSNNCTCLYGGTIDFNNCKNHAAWCLTNSTKET